MTTRRLVVCIAATLTALAAGALAASGWLQRLDVLLAAERLERPL